MRELRVPSFKVIVLISKYLSFTKLASAVLLIVEVFEF